METSVIHLIGCLRISDGDLDKIREMVQKIVNTVEASEPNTKAYEWYVNAAGDKGYVSEIYTGSDALMVHLQNVGPALGPLFEIAPLTELLVFGTPSDEVVEALSGFGAQFFPSMVGFSR